MNALAVDFAVHVAQRRLDHLPPAAVIEAKALVQDYLGVALRGATTAPARIVADFWSTYAAWPAEAGIIGSTTRISAQGAAFANAVAAHGIELDDVDQHSLLHFSAPVVSAALAAAQAVSASGGTFLTAVVTGCEIMQAVSDGVNPGMRDRGFHSTSMCGVFGATAAAAVALGLGEKELASAFGIAGAHAAGPLEIYGPTAQKRLQPGPAAHNGIVSARLAALGYEGAPTIFDGEFGIFHATTPDPDPAAARARLATGAPLGIEFKPYACFRPIHTAIDCAVRVRPAIADVGAIRGLHLDRHPMWATYHLIPAPATHHEAQGSINHAVAVALVDGAAGIEQFGADRIADPRVARLSRMLTTSANPTLPRGDSCRLTVTLADGRELIEVVDYPLGSVHAPMSPADHAAKFAYLTDGLLTPERAAAVRALVARLEEVADVSTLADLLP